MTNNSSYSNTGHGIETGGDCLVTGNSVANSYADGIVVSNWCRVNNNVCNANGSGGDGAGIHAIDSHNHIENNSVGHSDRGLDIDASDNVIADNVVADNSDNYDIAAGNALNILLCEVPEAIYWPAKVTLAGTLTVASPTDSGITFYADDVTIDLAGHSLIGPGPGAQYGIWIFGRRNVQVSNGTVRGFRVGIYEHSTAAQEHRTLKARQERRRPAFDGLQCDMGSMALLSNARPRSICGENRTGEKAGGEREVPPTNGLPGRFRVYSLALG